MKKEILTEKVMDRVKQSLLLGMATVGRISCNNNAYKIAVHGPATNDIPMPHIHIYLANDVFPYLNFDFEISLVDLVCHDKTTLIAQVDKSKNIYRKDKTECSWEGYRDLHQGFQEFLIAAPMKKPYKGVAKNNLQVAIMEWDNENNDNMADNESLMKKFLEEKGHIILPKYLPYFNY